MRAVVQRVTEASVTLKATGERRVTAQGMVTLLGIAPGDTEMDARWLVEKLMGLRIFNDENGRMNLSLLEIESGSMLIVSQFTLLGKTRKGRRPSFAGAAHPDLAEPLYDAFVRLVRLTGIGVRTGEFGAEMVVEITNDGPVTLIVETPPRSV